MSKQVMIVDDEEDFGRMVVKHLSDNGVEAVWASGCAQCLEYLKNGFSGIVLMDLKMPEKDGWDTISDIIDKGYGKQTTIVLLSASSDKPSPKAEKLRQHVKDFIPKPVSLQILHECVQNYLQNLGKKS